MATSRKRHNALIYMAVGALLILLPSYAKHYKGHAGKLLVAEPGVTAPFNQTVVFLAYQDAFSAWGFIINKPFAWKSKNMKGPAYYGGPVEQSCPNRIFGRASDGTFQLALADDPKAQSFKDKRVVLGCAGWGPLQLNMEIASGGWRIINYDPEIVFETPADKIWDVAHNRALQDSVIKQKKKPEQYMRKK
jgi:putative transcriptional regulator